VVGAIEGLKKIRVVDSLCPVMRERRSGPQSPVLTVPQPNEDLLLYIAVTDRVVSMVLMVERDEPGHVYKV
jgi:hypothetical protein